MTRTRSHPTGEGVGCGHDLVRERRRAHLGALPRPAARLVLTRGSSPLPLVLVAILAQAPGCSRRDRTALPPMLYVTDEEGGSVVVVDPVAGQVAGRFAVGKRPRGLRPSRDGRTLYVALSGSPRSGPGVDEARLPPPDRGADGVAVIDVAARKVARVLPSGPDPEALDLSPDGKLLYVSNEESAELTAVDIPSGAIVGRVGVGREPEGVTVRPDGKVVFVTAEMGNEVTVVDAATLAVVAHVPTGPRPRSIVFTTDGATAFVTDELGAMVTVIDAVAYRREGDIALHEDSPMPSGPRPMGAVLSADSRQLYVTCGRGGSVAVIDVASRKQVRSIDGVGDRPWGIALAPDGARLYTANGTSHDLSVVDLATGNVERRVALGGLPWGVVMSEAPRR